MVVDEAYGSPGLGKSLRSFIEILRGFEREAEILFERSGELGFDALHAGLGAWPVREFLGELLRPSPRRVSKAIARLTGLADAESLRALRRDLEALAERVERENGRSRELEGQIARLKAAGDRLNAALGALARMQGRAAARLELQARNLERVERLTRRRDDHITRLIRDTTGQRAQLERLARRLEENGAAADPGHLLEETRGRLEEIETRLADLKRMQATGAQGLIETLESLRDRIGRLETRAAEMSREVRAKSARLDALTRHVASVDNRLSAALGRPRKAPEQRVANRRESAPATG